MAIKLKYIKNNKDDFYNSYYSFRNILNNSDYDDLEKEITNLVKLINEIFHNKYNVNIEFLKGRIEKEETSFTFGKALYTAKPTIQFYIDEVIAYKNFMLKQKIFDIDIFIFEVIFNNVFHEFVHCIEYYRIGNKKLDLNTFMETITFALSGEIDKSIIDYYNNPLEIEAHYCSYLFMKDLSIIVNKYSILCKSSIYLNNIFVGLISDLDCFCDNNVIISRNDFLINSVYKFKQEKSDIFDKKFKNYTFIRNLFTDNHIYNLKKMIDVYAENEKLKSKNQNNDLKEMVNNRIKYKEQENLENLYSYLLIYEIKLIDKELLKSQIDDFVEQYGYDVIYKLFSNIYDILINRANQIYCKYKICYNLPYIKYFKNQMGISRKILNEKMKNTWIYNENNVKLMNSIVKHLENK